jgi:gamma-D-glutamyl-L-lysine dipeptidyl-peptidase
MRAERATSIAIQTDLFGTLSLDQPRRAANTTLDLDRLVDDTRRAVAPDAREHVFDVRLEPRGSGVAVVGQATAGADELVRVLEARLGKRLVTDAVERLPARGAALDRVTVSAPFAPVHGRPSVAAPLTSQYVLGQRLEVLGGDGGAWLRVRGGDGYLGWVNRGYVTNGVPELHDPVISLGAPLLPFGARVERVAADRVRLPNGRELDVDPASLVSDASLAARFPKDPEAIVASALAWRGTPYVWGGVTREGTDCSGLTQSVFRMHGVELPRDADQQSRAGAAVTDRLDFTKLRAGDLLFFSENGEKVTHVALSLGGSRIVHASLRNGGVAVDDLAGDSDVAKKYAGWFVTARRVLGDASPIGRLGGSNGLAPEHGSHDAREQLAR